MEFYGLEYIVFHSPCVEAITDVRKRAVAFKNGAKIGPWAEAVAFIEALKAAGLPVRCCEALDSEAFAGLKCPTIPAVVLWQPDRASAVWAVRSPADLDPKLIEEGQPLHPTAALARLAEVRLATAERRRDQLHGKDVLDTASKQLTGGQVPATELLTLALKLVVDSARGLAPTATPEQMQAAGLSPRQLIVVNPGETLKAEDLTTEEPAVTEEPAPVPVP